MAGLAKRLNHLEEQSRVGGEPSEEERKRQWLATANVRRNDDKHPTEWHVWDVIRLLRMQGRLPASTEGLRERLLRWRPPLGTRAVERVLARAIYDQEPGTENMVCPPEWRESFVAARELLEKYMAVPVEALARWATWQYEIEEGADDEGNLEEKQAHEARAHGITEELMLAAIGPDAEEIEEDELMRRRREILADLHYGEKGYQVQQHITRLMNEERSNA